MDKVNEVVEAVVPNADGKTNESVVTDDTIVEYQVRGETVRKPWKEAKNGYMMQEDYTRSKQEVAARAKELDSIHGGLTKREQAVLEKEAALEERRKMVDQILGGKGNSTPKKVEVADDDVLTGAQARELLKQEREELQRSFDTKLNETTGRLTTERQYERWEDLTNKTIETLKSENPILETIPHLDIALKREAMKDNPKTEQEMISSFVKAGKDLVKKLDTAFEDRTKKAAIKRKEVLETAPDRVTGQPVFKSPNKTYMKGQGGRNIDWNSIENDVIAAIENQED